MQFKLPSSGLVNQSEDDNITLYFSGTIVASSGQSAKFKGLLPQVFTGILWSAQAPCILSVIDFFWGWWEIILVC